MATTIAWTKTTTVTTLIGIILTMTATNGLKVSLENPTVQGNDLRMAIAVEEVDLLVAEVEPTTMIVDGLTLLGLKDTVDPRRLPG